ncbi:MAG: hypothetical protein ACHQEB_03810 [Chitinophagales bacterium]
MKLKILLFAGAIVLLAWSNTTRNNNKEAIDLNTGDGTISFKVNGAQVKTSGFNISLFSLSGQHGVNVTSNMHEDVRTVSINVNALKPGTYPFKRGTGTYKTAGVAYGAYRPEYLKKMMDYYSFESGEFTIVAIDTTAHTFSATFSGKVKNSKGVQFEITEGKVSTTKLKSMQVGPIR